MAAAQEQDVVLWVTLNNTHKFVVAIAKNSSIADLKTEITKVSRLLFSSVDLGEITSVQTCDNHELPDIYNINVGRLLKEGDRILAFSTSHLSNHVNPTFNKEDAGELEGSQNFQSQKAIKNKSDTTDISKDFPGENSTKETEVLDESCDNEQECSSERNGKEDMDERNITSKDSCSSKGKTQLKTQDYELASSCNAEQEYSNKMHENKTAISDEEDHKSSGCTKEKSRDQIQDFEDTSSSKDAEITDIIFERESTEHCEEIEDRNSEGSSLERSKSKLKEQNLQTLIIDNKKEHQSTTHCQDKVEDNLSKQFNSKKGKHKDFLFVDNNCNDKEESASLNTEQEDTDSEEIFTSNKLKHKKPQKILNISKSDDSTPESKKQSEDVTSRGEKQHKIQDNDDIDVISEDFSLEKTKNKKLESQTTRSESFKNRDKTTEDANQDLVDAIYVDTNGENPRKRAQNIQNKKIVFQMENFILQSEEENYESRAEDGQKEKSRTTDMRTRKGVFNTPTSEKTPCFKDPTEGEKISKRKWKRSRTQSIDESLADEDQRNRPCESASTGSQPSSIVSEIVLKSQAFKAMLETTGCFSQRRRQAIEKSVTKVATWLVDQNEDINDETPIALERMSTEVLDDTVQEPLVNHCVKDALNSNAQEDDSCDIYLEDVSRIFPIIDVLSDRVLYFDSDPSDASSSGGLIKEAQLLTSCRVLIPKLKLTKSLLKGLKSGYSVSEPQSIAPEVIPIELNVAKRAEEESGAVDCQDMNEEDCGYGSHGFIGSSGSEELFPASPKLKHLTSYTIELLPSNKPLEHVGNEKEKDRESCSSTEILDSEKAHSLPKKLKLPLNVEGVTANETSENEHRHGQKGEKSQESLDKILKNDTNTQLKMVCEETVDKSQAEKDGTEQRDTKDAETESSKTEQVDLSSPKKKKKKSSGERTLANTDDGSALSENSLEDKTSKERKKQDIACSEDNRAEENSEESMSYGRKKKEKRSKTQERISNKDNSIQEDTSKPRSVIPESSGSSPRKGFANTELSFQKSLANSSNDVTSIPEKLKKEKSSIGHKKNSSKNKAFTGESQDIIDSGDEFQTCNQSAVAASKEKDQESVTEEKSFEKKAKKKKKKKANISTEDTSKRKEKQKKNERQTTNEECHSSKEAKISSFGSRESTVLCVNEPENSVRKKRKKEKKKRRDKVVEDEKVDICKEELKKKSSKASKRPEGEEFEATIKPVEQVDQPVSRSAKSKHDSDETEKERKKTRDKTKKELKRTKEVENNMNKVAEDRDPELLEDLPKKKRKKSQRVCEGIGKASLKGSSVPSSHPDMFSSGSEDEVNIGVTDVLSWISNKISNQTTKKSSTKKTNKSALLDLAQEDQELNAHKTPIDSVSTSVCTPKSSSSRSRIFVKTPTGFTNTVPRISKKLNLTSQTVASCRRKRKLSNSPPQSRELTGEEKEMLSGGVKRLEELLDDDSFWD